MFCGGISSNLSRDDLMEYFSTFGAIVSLRLGIHKPTGGFRGFCYIKYEDLDVLNRVVEMRTHEIKGFTVETKHAFSKTGSLDSLKSENERKLFLFNIPNSVTEEALHSHFRRFGEIENLR